MSTKAAVLFLMASTGLETAFGQPPGGPVKVGLDQAIQMAVQHNQALLAARTTIQQSLTQEISANLRPNPELSTGLSSLPLYRPEEGLRAYLHDSFEFDVGVSYLIERGQKRQLRFKAAKDGTAITRSQVEDNERTLKFQVASQFINVQLAESVLDLSQQNLASFQKTVDLAETQFKAGSISENDSLKIKLQLVQFQTDVQQAQLSRVQALSDLRQLLGHETVPADYTIAGTFDYQPLVSTFEELQAKALQNRPDLRAAQQGVSAANSQYALAKANGKQDVSVGGSYARSGGFNTASVGMSIPLAIFDRNQGEIARTRYAISQAQYGLKGTSGQVMTDVRDAYESLQTNDRVVKLYRAGNLEISQKNRDISEYAYQRGATTLLDFLDAERSYRATQLAYRQALAAYLLATGAAIPGGRNQEPSVTRAEVRARIEEVGIVPAVRVASSDDARFAAETVYDSGIPTAEITMTTPGAIEVISHIARDLPEMIVGAGTVLDVDTARRCVDAGALFLTSTGLVLDVLEFALANDIAVFPGALSPTEVIAAWRAGADFVKVFPCSANGGYRYIRALKVPLPQIPMIASGGVNQQTAFDFIRAGAAALGIGAELMPQEALRVRNRKQIRELARRYLGMVKDARELLTGGTP